MSVTWETTIAETTWVLRDEPTITWVTRVGPVTVTGGAGLQLSGNDPESLGVTAPGTSARASHSDHVHAMPNAADVGAITEANADERYDAINAASTAQSNAEAFATSAVDALSTVYQPLDSDLTAIALLATTPFGRALLTMADAAATRSELGLGSAATMASGAFDAAGLAAAAAAASQPVDSDLTAIAGLGTTNFGRGFLVLANAAAARAAIELTAANTTYDPTADDWADLGQSPPGDVQAAIAALASIVLVLTNNFSSFITIDAVTDAIAALGTAAHSDAADFATADQGSEADSAVQPADIAAFVSGPPSSVEAHVALFADTTGKVVEDSGITLGGLAQLSTVGSAQVTDGSLVNADLASMANKTYKGRHTAGTGAPEDVTAANLKADLSIVIGDLGAIADQTVVGNVSGGSAAPVNLTKAQLLTLLGVSAPVQQPLGYIPFVTNGTPAIASTVPAELVTSTAVTPTSGRAILAPIWLTAGTVITNLSFFVGGTGATSPTHSWMALTDSAGSVVAATADATTTPMTTTNAPLTRALTSTYTVPTTGRYYVVFTATAGTPPLIRCASLVVAQMGVGSYQGATGLTTAPSNGTSLVGTPAYYTATIYALVS